MALMPICIKYHQNVHPTETLYMCKQKFWQNTLLYTQGCYGHLYAHLYTGDHAVKVEASCFSQCELILYITSVGGSSMSLLCCSGYYCKQTMVYEALRGLLKQIEAVFIVFVNEPEQIIGFKIIWHCSAIL